MENPFEKINDRLTAIEEALYDLRYKGITVVKDTQEDSEWLDLKGLCSYLPTTPAFSTVYAWVSTGTIPYHKRGGRLFFVKSEIDAWIKDGGSTTAQNKLPAKIHTR